MTQQSTVHRRSVVKIITTIRERSQYQPWTFEIQEQSGGSGVIVDGARILTNAHVVSNQIFIQVAKPDDPKRYTAHVDHVDDDSELALLSVDDRSFFDETVSVTFGQMPPQSSSICVFGFPHGDDLAITNGTVSRIEVKTYTHSRRMLLALQTDAVISAGSSGGPAFLDEFCVGVVFQGSDNSRSSYIIPTPVIDHFFEDVKDGNIGGVPDLGICWQKLESASLREYLGLRTDQTGILVTQIVYGSSSHDIVQQEDVILTINGQVIACDGSVLLSPSLRVNFSHLVSTFQIGELLRICVLRDRRILSLEVALKQFVSLVPLPNPSTWPKYLIFAGFVFVCLTSDYMGIWDWEKVSFRFKYLYYDGLPQDGISEAVIISQTLPHDINIGYHRMFGMRVVRVNRVKIGQISDVLRALMSPEAGFHVIEVENQGPRTESDDRNSDYGSTIVVRADGAGSATRMILKQNGIEHGASPDMLEGYGALLGFQD